MWLYIVFRRYYIVITYDIDRPIIEVIIFKAATSAPTATSAIRHCLMSSSHIAKNVIVRSYSFNVVVIGSHSTE
jgi:hypothetical protein